MAKPKTVNKAIEIFRAGKYPQRTITTEDLDEVVECYNEAVHEAPYIVGHESDYHDTRIPAFGWAKSLKRVGDVLQVVKSEFTEQLVELVEAGHYKKISAGFYPPESPTNPYPGKWSLRHIAVLGAEPPAVKALAGINFAEFAGADFVDFSDATVEAAKTANFRDTYEQIQQQVAEFLASLQTIFDSEIDDEMKVSNAFNLLYPLQCDIDKTLRDTKTYNEKSESILGKLKEYAEKFFHKQPEGDTDMTEQEAQAKVDAALAAKETEFAEKLKVETAKAAADAAAAAKAEAEASAKDKAIEQEINEFAEAAKKTGHWTPKMDDLGIRKMMFALAKAGEVEFAEGQKRPMLEIFKDVINSANPVEFGEHKETAAAAAAKTPTGPEAVVAFAEQHVDENPEIYKGLNRKQAVAKAIISFSNGTFKK